MSIRYFIVLLLILISQSVTAQKEANWWFFGVNAGLDFNSGTPVVSNLGQLITNEGCSSISDSCGALLFYTDGISVYDSTHSIMQNGDLLLGNPSSTQSGIIVPVPSSTTLYYIFTVDIGPPSNGLNYSIVDITLNGGLGAIIPNRKNINLIADTAEKVTAVSSRDGDFIWIITYAEQNLGSGFLNTFYAYKLTSTGIDFASTQNSTLFQVQTTDRRGYLKVAPDGSKLAMMTQLPPIIPTDPLEEGRGAWLFDFDNQTGRVSNPLRLVFTQGSQVYGTEFSPDSSKIYVDLNTTGNGFPGDRSLLQYDLNLPRFQTNPSLIFSTDINDPQDDVSRGALQIGPDQKIYYARDNQDFLGVVNNPNAAGIACNYVNDGIALAPGTQSTEGLPPFLNSFFEPSFTVNEKCFGDPSDFEASPIAGCPGSTLLWDFGDPASGANNTSTSLNETHDFSAPGRYTVSLVITTLTVTYNSTKEVIISPPPTAFPISNIDECDNANTPGGALVDLATAKLEIVGNQNPADYTISIHGSRLEAENNTNALSDPLQTNTANLYARIQTRATDGCYAISEFDVRIFRTPLIDPIIPINICDDFSNDGEELVDLTLKDTEILNGQNPAEYEVSYHATQADAVANNPLNDMYPVNVPNQTIIARISNSAHPECFATNLMEINLYHQPEAPILNNLETCDDEQQDYRETFNFTQTVTNYLASQPPTTVISFFTSLQEAQSGLNPINNNFQNNVNPQQIWLRVENSDETECFDISSFMLEVLPYVDVELPDDSFKCIDDEILLDAGTGYASYLWSTGETAQQITVTQPNIYSVTVSNVEGCTATDEVEIQDYQLTQIDAISIDQFTIRDNKIVVSASGSGPFEYSLDGFNYQDSNIFENLFPGFYTIYVRDKNGCDLVTATATIVAARSYFTPNNDGIHDYWQVIAIETEPDAEIFIFDRFGKLLKQISPLGPGWDGTYIGSPMPSTDYWFTVKLIDGRSFKGTF